MTPWSRKLAASAYKVRATGHLMTAKILLGIRDTTYARAIITRVAKACLPWKRANSSLRIRDVKAMGGKYPAAAKILFLCISSKIIPPRMFFWYILQYY